MQQRTSSDNIVKSIR